MTVIEELTPAEFPILSQIHEGYVPPDRCVVFVAKCHGEIVGRVFLMEPVHVEGPWVKEDHRGGIIGKRLMDAAAEKAKNAGVKKLFAYAADETLAGYLKRLGYQQEPYTVWTKEL
jgi:N-acetylglutamate synthase-like GNAT family acetyltransferase